MDDLHGTHIKGYQLIERIGSGGFGAVYRAKQSTIGREVAVKIILPGFANNPDFIRRFETEAYLVARLEHPHITPLHDYWRDPQGAYLVMRYLRGGSVRDALADGPYELEALSYLLDQIASALDFAHRGGVIHRDIKPGNILLDEDANAYLADFGIAKDLSRVQDGLTAKDALVGSLDYISPEQARSEPVTPRTDIYSLGVTLYEMITGEHPFKEVSSAERLYKHINDLLPEISGLPDGLQDTINKIIQQATAKDPAQRYPDVLALAVAFREGVGRGTTNGVSSVVEQLTLREQEILSLIARGMSNREVADHLVITIGTVKWHLNQLYKKLGVRGRVQAIVRARELDLIVTGDSRVVPQIVGSEASRSVLLPEPENPYKGLHAFQMADAPDFFGREALVEKLVADMQAKTPNQRFLAVVGPSGSGKSSLVRAGLIPALWRGALPGSEKWFVVDMIPGTHPLDKLEVALMRVAANQANNLHEQLARDARGLLRVADLILPGDDSELLVVVDQFEEVFTLVEDEASRQHFLDLIGEVVSDPHSRVRVVVTLRADYYDRPLNYPAFGELVRSRLETVLPLSAQGLERAVRGPAERVGVTFEQGLVEQIVSEMTYQAGALPLLQYALTELFDRRSGRLLTREAYQAIGGAVGALANRADDIYTGLSEPGQGLAEQMFMRLVTLGEGAEDTRRRIPQAELLDLSADRDLMEEIIEQFADFRLLSLDHDPETRQPTVEVAHEAILRDWERLRAWINAARDDLRLHGQLTGLVSDWQSAGQDPSYLLHGARLVQFESWAAETSLVLTPREKGYIAASIQARAARDTAERSRQERETAQERRSRRLLRTLVAVLAVAAVGAMLFSLFALDREQTAQAARDEADIARQSEQAARVEAEDSLRRTTAQRLGLDAAALALSGGEADLIALLTVRSLNTEYTPQGDFALQQALQQPFPTAVLDTGLESGGVKLALSPDGSLLAGAAGVARTADFDNGIMVWDLATQTRIAAFGAAEEVVAFLPDGERLAGIDRLGNLNVYNARTGELLYALSDLQGFAMDLAVLPLQNALVLGGLDGSLMLLDMTTWETTAHIQPHKSWVHLGVSMDGRRLLTGGSVFETYLWDTETMERLAAYDHEKMYAFSPAMSADGRRFITGSGTGMVFIWDVDHPDAPLYRFQGHYAGMQQNSMSPDGRFAVTSSNDTRVRFWDLETGQEARPPLVHPNTVLSVLFSPDGQTIYTSGADRYIRLWNAEFQPPVMAFDTILTLHPNAFSADGTHLAMIQEDMLSIVDLETREARSISDGVLKFGLAYTQDGGSVLVGANGYFGDEPGAQGEVFMYDANTLELTGQYERMPYSVVDIDVSDDGQYVAAIGMDPNGTVMMWDAETQETVLSLSHGGASLSLDISPDSRYLLAGNWGGVAAMYDAANGEEVWREEMGWGQSDVQFSPDGSTFVASGGGPVLRIWDTETRTQIGEITGHVKGISSLSFSPDGTLLMTGSEDGTARIWDLSTGEEVRRFYSEFINHVLISPDGQRVLVDDNIRVRLWNLDIHDDITYLCRQVTRDFTPAERQFYEIGDEVPTCPSTGE